MKKIYFILSLAATALLSSCSEDFNEHNFSGYKDASNPTNVVTYNYTLTDADYSTIGNSIKQPVTDSISAYKSQLKTATHADSITLNAAIDRLDKKQKTDSVYIKATYIGDNKILNSKLKGKDYLPILLNKKYTYVDKESIIKITYDNVDNGDTLSIPATSRFTLAAADYIQMGTGTNQPGQYKNMSSSIASIMTYLNTYLKTKCPYAVSGDVKSVGYIYYDSNKTTKKQYRILTFDGQNWGGTTEQYVFNGSEWVFDPTVYIVQTSNDKTTDADKLPGNMKNMFSVIVHSVWSNEALKKYVSSYKNDEYYYGASAYQGNFSFQYSVREAKPYSDAELIALSTESDKIKLMFNRLNDAIIIYLKYTYPNSKPVTSDGLNQYYVVTYKVYEKYPSSSSTNTYQSKFQCTGSNPATFKFIERKKL